MCNPIQVLSPNIDYLKQHLPLNSSDRLLNFISFALQTPLSPQNPQCLTEKQVVCILQELASVKREANYPNYILSRYSHNGDIGPRWPPYCRILNKIIEICQDTVRGAKKDILYRYQLANSYLLKAEAHRCFYTNPLSVEEEREGSKKDEKDYIDAAYRQGLEAKKISRLHSLSYYIDCLILEYKGVDCAQIEQVEKYIRLLKQCVALDLDSQYPEIEDNLGEAITYVRQRWSTLHQERAIRDEVYQQWNQKLDKILANDSLKELFRGNPKLFNLSNLTMHTVFFARHPELKNKQAFVAKYPECAKEMGIELPKAIQQSTQQVTPPKPANLVEKENTQPNQSLTTTFKMESFQPKQENKSNYSIQTIDEIVEQRIPLSKCILLDLIPIKGSDGTPVLVFLDQQKAEEFVIQCEVPHQDGSFILKGIKHEIMIAPEHMQSTLRENLHRMVAQDATGSANSKFNSNSPFFLQIWRTKLQVR